MKSNLQLQTENRSCAQTEISDGHKGAVLVPVTRQKLSREKEYGMWDRIAGILERIFIALDQSATRARRMDEQIRRQQLVHYAKYGQYFRERS
jgi:hypothetical protein